jgi:hypothetical protein
MPKFAYIGDPTNIGSLGLTDIGGIQFPLAFQSSRSHVYELTITFSVVPATLALRGIVRVGNAKTIASGTVTPLDDADSPVIVNPVRAVVYGPTARTVLNFAVNESTTYTWSAMDDDQRIVLSGGVAGILSNNALTAGCITTTANAGLTAVADFKFENT